MIILSTAALGDGRATLRGGYSYSKKWKDWNWEMKKCEKEMEG